MSISPLSWSIRTPPIAHRTYQEAGWLIYQRPHWGCKFPSPDLPCNGQLRRPGALPDGSVFDSSRYKAPFSLLLGAGQVISG